ncbi:MAG: HEAT repeat domain-containing protein [Microcystis sp. M54BS1]|uniref:HEAT repeat domain-containing protein n=2 Tax=unclassified Microcystis TaxID=2643300 RepID=UPI00257B003C|nr:MULTISPECIES: HEAT repeat domain-containing protein [unclassified Microcystis]MCA2504873.1 HEAT repeat domain-containing protein [Microcystis sp. M62BS1]MCA2537709.1 HEAT repeat domain-containing protein [Microcystis sp. M54BS1]MCA2566321.1 HEAT repeat domain-containing protein [Microcystis sp. M44BS1]MCA2596089.1 HEAT repeat domain-containing protein [Microcystis sp. M38BS1]MCA2612138.1 HEAT repeat domain-containing protein [Microcystis sp. M27BS1]
MKTLSPMKSYYSREWNFSIAYPTDWEILWENKPAGSWTIPIAVAGKEGSGGRPCFSVNVRRGKILQGNPHLKITGLREDGKLIEYPSTPQEYIEQQKAELPSCFSGFQFISGEEIRLAHQPAAKLVYRYDGAKGQIQEQSTTLFGVELTFQFVSEVPVQEAAKFQPAFNSILESFRIGDDSSETSSNVELNPQERSESNPVALYNRGVTIYRAGHFEQAIAAFDQCWQSGEYKMQAAYAKALCQGQLGLEFKIPPEFEGKEDEVGATYVASNFACYLICQGYQAALTNSSQVTAKVKGSVYIINIDGYLGTFLNDAWRKEGKERISLLDSNANPHPTEADQLIMSLIKMASSLPMCPLPEGGLPTALKADNREDSPEKPTMAVATEKSGALAPLLDSSAQKIDDSNSQSENPINTEISEVDCFINDLDDQDYKVRQKAVEELEKSGWQPKLDEKGAAYWIVKGKFDKCVEIGSPSVAPLIIALRNENAFVREGAARALGKIGDKGAIEPLIAILGDVDYVSEAAAEGLAKMGKVAIKPLLVALRDPNYWLQPAAWQVLGSLLLRQYYKSLIVTITIALLGPVAIQYLLDLYNFNQGHQAYQRADCTTAIKHFDPMLKGWRAINMEQKRAVAQQAQQECLAFQVAVDQQKAGNFSVALLTYNNFINDYSNSILVEASRHQVESIFETVPPFEIASHESCNSIGNLLKNSLIPSPDQNLPRFHLACGQVYQTEHLYLEALDQFNQAKTLTKEPEIIASAKQGYNKAVGSLSQDTGSQGQSIISAAYSTACGGKPAKSPAVGLGKSESGKALACDESALTLPNSLKPVKPSHFKYVVSLAKDRETIENCPYYALQGNATGTVSRRRQLVRVKLRSTQTGKIVKERVFRGSRPDYCPFQYTFWGWGTYGNHYQDYLDGAEPSQTEIIKWLSTVVR